MSMFNDAIEKLKQRQQLLAILLFSLVAVMVWIAVDLVSSQKSTAITPDLKAKALSLTPTISSQVLEQIEQETYYSEQELQGFPIYKVIDSSAKRTASSSGSPTPSPAPSVSPSPSLAPSVTGEAENPMPPSDPTATESGSL